MSEPVEELVEMARALSEGDCDRKFDKEFGGELGRLASYLEAMRQTLRSVYAHAEKSAALNNYASGGVAEIYREAENGVNSILEAVDQMSLDQEEAAALLADHLAVGLDPASTVKLKDLTDNTRRGLMTLIGYLSFQDVLRQRVEKVQGLIEDLEKRTLDLMVKFKVQGSEENATESCDASEDMSANAGLDQALIDQLMESLK